MKYGVLVMTAALLVATSVAAQDARSAPFDHRHLPSLPAPNSSRFKSIQSTFGTLAFDGVVERVDLGAAVDVCARQGNLRRCWPCGSDPVGHLSRHVAGWCRVEVPLTGHADCSCS